MAKAKQYKSELCVSMRDGHVTAREFKIVNQLDPVFNSSIKEFTSPKMICGYLACVVAEIVANHFASFHMKQKELKKMVKMLSHPAAIMESTREMMSWLRDCRRSYILAHKYSFPTEFINSGTEHDEAKYISDWVANYEISQWMNKKANKALHFVRCIEREFDNVYHEEKERLIDEKPFLDLKMFFDTTIVTGETRMFRPSEWLNNFLPSVESTPPVFIGDVGGHFVVLKPVLLESDGGEVPCIILLNTYHPNSYVEANTVTGTYRMIFEQKDETTDKDVFTYPLDKK